MKRPWEAEHGLTTRQAQHLIATQFPELADAPVRPEGAGWDNWVFSVGTELVFRFPRREIAAPLVDREWRGLPPIAAAVSLAVPTPRYRGRPDAGYPWSFLGQRRVPGVTACRANPDPAQRCEIAVRLGTFLRELHAIPPATVEVGPDAIGRMDFALRDSRIDQALAELVERRVMDASTAESVRALARSCAVPAGPRPRCVVHGDLYVRHLVVDAADPGRLRGVIDWGDLHRGDPALDLAIARTFLPAAAESVLLEHYGPVDETTWRRATYRGVYHTLALLQFGHARKDPDLEREAHGNLRRLLRIRDPGAASA